MKYSRYNYCVLAPDRAAILNTFTGNVCVMTMPEYQDFLNLKCLSYDKLEQFRSMGIITDDDVNELEIIKFDNACSIVNSRPHIRVLTTTGCNAKCPYCYEAGTPKVTMSDTVARSVAQFIKSKVCANNPISIEWFGGEPLTNFKAIEIICSYLNDNKVSFSSSMVSNGVLLTEARINFLKEIAHLEKIQISLDAVGEKYDVAKGLPAGSFNTVIHNIRMLANAEITVQIRFNLGQNQEEIRQLIGYLGKNIGFHKRIFYYAYPLFEASSHVHPEKLNTILEINDLLVKEGLMKVSDLYHFQYRSTGCYARTMNGFTIGPDGRLFNCTHTMNVEGSVGSIEKSSEYNPKRLRFLSAGFEKPCESCILLPICGGGCKAAELKLADINQCHLFKGDLEAVMRRLLSYYEKGGA